jgi:hypothetical protein
MRINKILYKLSLLVGLFIFLSGVFFKLTQNIASGYLFRKNGNIQFGVIDGNGALTLGIMILAFALWMYRVYKAEAMNIEKQKQIEKNDRALKKRINGSH